MGDSLRSLVTLFDLAGAVLISEVFAFWITPGFFVVLLSSTDFVSARGLSEVTCYLMKIRPTKNAVIIAPIASTPPSNHHLD